MVCRNKKRAGSCNATTDHVTMRPGVDGGTDALGVDVRRQSISGNVLDVEQLRALGRSILQQAWRSRRSGARCCNNVEQRPR